MSFFNQSGQSVGHQVNMGVGPDLEAENDRLRRALESIVALDDPSKLTSPSERAAYRIARQALGRASA